MKLVTALLFFFGLGSVPLAGQALNIKGSFTDTDHRKHEAHYVLSNDDSTVYEGNAKKIKLALSLNQNYVLTVSSEGYTSKTIRFSTFTDTVENFDFEFSVVLHREPLHKMNSTAATENGHVFFDQKKKNFNYKRH